MVVPTPRGEISPAVLAAARIGGVTEVYRIGGAQAIGALAYGTETIRPVSKIFGPGNAYVAAAKRQVFGTVGIDTIAGPSEVVVIADASANPSWVAADLLAQAEHGGGAQSILITTDAALADAVSLEVDRQMALLPRAQITRGRLAGVRRHHPGAVAGRGGRAHQPHRLGTCRADARRPAGDPAEDPQCRRHLPRPPYARGHRRLHRRLEPRSTHARSARYASGLGVLDFMKRTTLLGCDPGTLAALAPAAVTLAETEGLSAHGRSISIRLNR